MSKYWFLEEVNLFNLLCPHKYKAHVAAHEPKSFSKNDFIYMDSDAASKVYLIERGKVKIGYYDSEGNEIIKSILSRGELFGEHALLGADQREEFAQSLAANTNVCAVSTDQMQDLMREHKALSLSIRKFLGFRFKKLERRLQMLLFKDTATRLKEFIAELVDEFGETKGEEVHIQHPYTQQDIATLIGTSRTNLNIIMNEWKQQGQIDFNRKSLILFPSFRQLTKV